MNYQIILELILIATTITIFIFIFNKYSKSKTKNEKINEILIISIGSFLILGGSAKFFHPFNEMFLKQITLSGLPFPELSKVLGQFGEIFAGILYLASLKFNEIKSLLLKTTTLLTLIIMTVALYVHASPNVPAEYLPLQTKEPYLTLIIIFIVITIIKKHLKGEKKNDKI